MDLSCRELIDFIEAYLDQSLTLRERLRFEQHLEHCPYCVNYLASYRETIRLGRQILDPLQEIPESVPEDLVRAVLAARGS